MSALLEHLLIRYARRFPVRRGKLRVIDACWRAAAGGRGTHRMARLAHGDFAMPCDLTEMLQRQFYFFGTYFLEENILAFWQQAARDADVVFDVGANAGIYSLAALAAQPSAVVHAFEPTPEIAARLRTTATLNRLAALHVHEAAVLQEDGFASLHEWRGETGANAGMNFVRAGAGNGQSRDQDRDQSRDQGRDQDRDQARRVRAVSLDGFCRAHAIERIDLLKIDIQGQEHAALAGARGLLAGGRIGTIVTELNWTSDGGVSPADEAIGMLDAAGYRFAKPMFAKPMFAKPLFIKSAATLDWRVPGSWLREESDIVARRIGAAARVRGAGIR